MSKQIKVLGSGDRRVVLLLDTHVSGWKVDRRVLATDIDAELGLITCVWDRIGQMTRRQVSGVGEAVSGTRAQRRKVHVYAYGEVLSVHSLSWCSPCIQIH